MTQEEKDLLLKDICTRLPYGFNAEIVDMFGYTGKIHMSVDTLPALDKSILLRCKPYLRPMSSMTEGEKKEAEDFGFGYYDEGVYEKEDGERITFGNKTFQLIPTIETYDWLKSHHFDYRGLIPMGLALPAHEDMYNIK